MIGWDVLIAVMGRKLGSGQGGPLMYQTRSGVQSFEVNISGGPIQG